MATDDELLKIKYNGTYDYTKKLFIPVLVVVAIGVLGCETNGEKASDSVPAFANLDEIQLEYRQDIQKGNYVEESLKQFPRFSNKHLIFDGKSETFTNNREANQLLKPAYRGRFRIPERV